MSSTDKKITNELALMLAKQKAMLSSTKEYQEELSAKLLSVEVILKSPVERFALPEEAVKLSHFMKKFPNLRVFGRYENTGTPVVSLYLDSRKDFKPQLNQFLEFVPHLQTIPKLITAPFKIDCKHIKIGVIGESNLALVFPAHRPKEIWLIDDSQLITQIIRKFTSPTVPTP